MAASVQPPAPDFQEKIDSVARRIDFLEASLTLITEKLEASIATMDTCFAAKVDLSGATSAELATLSTKHDTLASKVDIMPTIIMESFGSTLATALPGAVEISWQYHRCKR